MGFRDLSVKTKLILLLCLLMSALVGTEAYNWHALDKSGERLAMAIREGNNIEEAIDTSRRAQVEFKIHVQEWKNLLVRGGDAKDFESYSKALDVTGKQVVDELQKLLPQMKTLGLSTEPVEKALAEQASLNK